MNKNIVLTGGGTAGHIMPNIALLPSLKMHFDNIYYIGSENGMEKDIAKKNGISYYSTPVIKLIRDKLFINVKIPFILIQSILKAKKILKKLQPSVIFSKGGYCALPTVFAAKALSLPVICHESDITLGLANRITLPFCKALITSFEKTHKKGICIGTPLRNIIFQGKPDAIVRNFDRIRPIILVLGGSLGAKAINDCIKKTMPALSNYNILHISGEDNTPNMPNYHTAKFVDNIQDYYAAADMVICRAGASTLAELTALGKKVLTVPLPIGASRGDQIANAEYYKQKGLIEVLNQEKLTPYNLIVAIEQLSQSDLREKNHDNTVIEKIIQVILTHAK